MKYSHGISGDYINRLFGVKFKAGQNVATRIHFLVNVVEYQRKFVSIIYVRAPRYFFSFYSS